MREKNEKKNEKKKCNKVLYLYFCLNKKAT